MTRDETIDRIQWIRAKNNKVWMDILRIALKSSPADTKELLRQIRDNDIQVSELTQKLAE